MSDTRHPDAPAPANPMDFSGCGGFEQLSPDHQALLAATAREVRYPAGRLIFAEGSHADRCWLIRDGHVRLDVHVPGRGEAVVQTLGPGDLLGWSWLVPPYLWQFSARAAEPVAAVEFDAAALARCADGDLGFARELNRVLFSTLLERLQATRARLLDLYRNPTAPHAS
jgi:CRP-like cAMP-binding protein